VTLVLCAHPEIRTTLNIQVIYMLVNNYSIILGRDWKYLTSGYLLLDGSHLSISKNGKNSIVSREGIISPYIEKVPQPNVNYIEEDMVVYSIFIDEDDAPIEQPEDYDDGMWHMHFDGACSTKGNKEGIILYSHVGKIHNFAHCLAKIQEHDLTIATLKTIKGCDLELHLAQHPKPSDSSESDENALSTLFYIENQNLDLA
jgi:hypothetical protein